MTDRHTNTHGEDHVKHYKSWSQTGEKMAEERDEGGGDVGNVDGGGESPGRVEGGLMVVCGSTQLIDSNGYLLASCRVMSFLVYTNNQSKSNESRRTHTSRREDASKSGQT